MSIFRRLGWLALFLVSLARAEVSLKDDTGALVRLPEPAQRIISLAPHITETLFAAGAGDRLVGVVEYSDYPAAARSLPRVGGYSKFDLEAIAAKKPDVVIGWISGNPAAQIEQLRALGLTMFMVQPNRIDDVATTLERFGELAGTSSVARKVAQAQRERLNALRSRYSGRPPVRVFYQVWRHPLLTVGGGQVISDVIRLCGGVNVFAGLKPLAPSVSVEAVLAANPEVIIVSGQGESRNERDTDWQQWKDMMAVQRGNVFHINPDLMQRHAPRLLDAAAQLCEHLEMARNRRKAG